MSWQRLSYAVFIAALLVMVAAVAIRMRSDAPRDAGLVAQLVSPGPLSSAHQSFAGQCTACHTPGKGVETRTCLTCHAGTDFGTKQSTQFHAKATQCTSCHVEHEGERGIIRMDHAALLDMAKWRQPLAGMSTNTRSLTPRDRAQLRELPCVPRSAPGPVRHRLRELPQDRQLEDRQLPPSIGQFDAVRRVPQGAAESLHGAFQHGLAARSRIEGARRPMLCLSRHRQLQQYPQARLV